MKRVAKRVALAGGLVTAGTFTFVYLAVDNIMKNTGKPPKRPPKH